MEQKPNNPRSFTAPIVTLFCSIVLAAGSCYGFLATLESKYASLKIVFLVVFCLCVMVFPGTIIWMIARAIRNRKAGNEVQK